MGATVFLVLMVLTILVAGGVAIAAVEMGHRRRMRMKQEGGR